MSLASEFAPAQDAHVRLTVLRLLADQPMGSANDAAIYEALNALALPSSRDATRAHLFWLGAQGLISVLDLRTSNGLVVGTLTEKGGDVAKGRSIVPGVERVTPAGGV